MRELRMLFVTDISGHQLEYIHHMYIMMLNKKEYNYIIIVPEEFKLRKSQYVWVRADNITFEYINNAIIDNINSSSIISSSFRRTKLLLKYLKKHRASHVFLISLIGFIPFLPVLIPSNITIIGIIYKIYLYEWKDYSITRKMIEVLKYKFITFNSCIKKVFILNDSSSAALFNKLYKVDKFEFLTDPFNADNYTPNNIKDKLGIPLQNIVFLHLGAMNKRKGTLSILKSISYIPQEKLDKISIIIAGVVRDDIKKEFYRLLDAIGSKCQIILYDYYCDKNFMADLCKSSDCMVLPYEVTAQSSGIIGYASYYNIPIIGPYSGLVGKLIRKYGLGKGLPELTPLKLAEEISNFIPYRTKSIYCSYSTINKFQKQISVFF